MRRDEIDRKSRYTARRRLAAGAAITGTVYVPEARIGVADAARAYTQGSAFAAFSDGQAGTLEAGSSPISSCGRGTIFPAAPEAIAKTRAVTTLVGGKIVYP